MLEGGFAGATVSKALTFASVASLFLDDVQSRFSLNVGGIGGISQLWRLVTSQLLFARTDGAVFGALGFYFLRQIERQMGSSKLAGFAIVVSLIAALMQAQLLAFFPQTLVEGLSAGPYALLFAMVLLYWRWVPRRHRVVSTKIFGVPVTEKFMTYLFIAQCFLAGGWTTLAPSICAIVPTSLYLSGVIPTDLIRTPDFLNRVANTIFAPFISTSKNAIVSNLTARQRQQQQEIMQQHAGTGHVGVDNEGNYVPRPNLDEQPAQSTQGPLAPMPPDDKIQAIMELGFDRAAVIETLRQSDNNVEIAAGRLFSRQSASQ